MKDHARTPHTTLLLAALAAVLAILALVPFSASAQVHLPKEVFGSAAQPSFTEAEEMAVIPEGLPGAGDLLVIDRGTATVSRFKPNGEPDPFPALGTNVIDGKGSGGCAFPPTPSGECDQTPQNGLVFGGYLTTQIAVAPAGATSGTGGDIYVTYQTFSPAVSLIDIFAPDGRYLGQLTEVGLTSTPIGGACGVAVDSSGAVYVGDLKYGIIAKFVPSANPPVNADNSANFTSATTTVGGPCGLAAGTKPLASGGSEGFLFATQFNGGGTGNQGRVVKLDSSTGAFQYNIAEGGKNTTVSVNAATGHVYVVPNKEFVTNGEVREYDASGAEEALEVSHITTGPPPLPAEGNVSGVAVSPSGDVYVATEKSSQIGVWGPAIKEPPQIAEEAALRVSADEATVTARIGAEEAPTTYHVDYVDQHSFEIEGGFASPHTLHTTELPAGSANLLVEKEETLSGLSPGTTYHWRFVATNTCATCGTTNGADRVLTTVTEHPFELPDGRVWEMVSPSEKSNGEVANRGTPDIQHAFSVRPVQSSPDGEAVTYASFTSFGKEAEGSPATSQFISRRGAEGWRTENVSPTFEEGYLRDPFVGFSDDLSKAAVISFNPPLAPGAPGGFWNLYTRDNSNREYEALTATEPQVSPGGEPCLAFAGASEDFERVIFAAKNEALLEGNPIPAVGGGAPNLYEWSAEVRDDLQALTVRATAGKYTLSFGPGVAETGEIAASASAGEVQTALNALTSISAGGGSVSVTGGPANAGGTRPYLIAFDGGPLAGAPQPPITATNVDLTGGSPSSGVSLATLAGGHLALASVLPNGVAATPQTNTSFGARNSFAGAGGCNMGTTLLRSAISANGLRSFWTYDGSTASPTAINPLFARLTDPETGRSETVELDAVQGGGLGQNGGGEYRGASRDGAKVFFTDEQRLTANAKEGDLYRYDVEKYEKGEPKPLEDLTPHAGEPAEVLGVLGVSDKGDFAYFAATAVLTDTPNPSTGDSAEKGKANVYAWHEGEATPHFIAALPSALPDTQNWSTNPLFQTARISPDGGHFAFLTTASPTGYDNTDQKTGERDTEVYLYDFDSGDLVCASCNPTGARPTGSSSVPVWTTPYEQPRYLSDDGGRLLFETPDALDPNDTNGAQACPQAAGEGGLICEDVYQFERAGHGDCSTSAPTYSPASGGCVSLISSGKSTDKSYLIDASADGRDIFLSSRESLVPPLDRDGVFDVYDARIGGSPPPPPPVECEGEACRGAGSGAAPVSSPRTSSFLAPPEPREKRCKSGFVAKQHGCVKKRHKKSHKHKRSQRRAHPDRRISR